MRTIVLAVSIITASILALVFLRPEFAQRVIGAEAQGAALAIILGIVLWLGVAVVAVLRKLRAGWRPKLSALARFVVSFWVLWCIGLFVASAISDWDHDFSRDFGLLFGPPLLVTLAAFLGRWVLSGMVYKLPQTAERAKRQDAN